MSPSVLDAIKAGIWDFELSNEQPCEFSSTDAIPGSTEKLSILACRVEMGLPLWHPRDRRTYDGSEMRGD